MLADWPGSAKGSAPLIRIVGEPCIPQLAASASSAIT